MYVLKFIQYLSNILPPLSNQQLEEELTNSIDESTWDAEEVTLFRNEIAAIMLNLCERNEEKVENIVRDEQAPVIDCHSPKCENIIRKKKRGTDLTIRFADEIGKAVPPSNDIDLKWDKFIADTFPSTNEFRRYVQTSSNQEYVSTSFETWFDKRKRGSFVKAGYFQGQFFVFMKYEFHML